MAKNTRRNVFLQVGGLRPTTPRTLEGKVTTASMRGGYLVSVIDTGTDVGEFAQAGTGDMEKQLASLNPMYDEGETVDSVIPTNAIRQANLLLNGDVHYLRGIADTDAYGVGEPVTLGGAGAVTRDIASGNTIIGYVVESTTITAAHVTAQDENWVKVRIGGMLSK